MRDGVPFSLGFGDAYHPAAGALQQARHVFLAGNGLPGRWRGRDRFVVLETGFGLGNNFLATWDAWRRDGRPCRLMFISIEQHPLTRADMASMPRDPSLAGLAGELIGAWPPLTPNLHRLAFDDGQVQLLLCLGDAAAWLPEIVARVDAFYLDGFTPSKNPQMWQPRLFKAMGRMAAPGATAATWSTARAVKEGLRAAGFDIAKQAGIGGKFEITVARHAPAFIPKVSASRRDAVARERGHAVIVGAGLAGCTSAWALAQLGWTSTVVDAHGEPAQETSGNPAGLFHGIVNPQDGAHARFNRAAALEAQRVIAQFMRDDPSLGQIQGLLRLDTSGADASAMRAMLAISGLPTDYVQAVNASEASSLAGMTLSQPAWFYPGGGWLRPAALCRTFLAKIGGHTSFVGHTRVHSLRQSDSRWDVLGADGQTIASGDAVILANAGDALRLSGGAAWLMQPVRGQLSFAPAAGLSLPRLPVAGSGYLLPPIDGRAILGATTHPDDADPTCREPDHRHNLSQAERLTGDAAWSRLAMCSIDGRVGWRWQTDDRLPVIGSVPLPTDMLEGTRLDQPRFVARQPGLFVFTGLASRGITWCALGAQLLASMVTGSPAPLEASLIDAVDAGRFASRQARRR
jgi:tRNA 5-methylaminomethyl-2-thiouridine biosynthesis bifunctional protein